MSGWPRTLSRKKVESRVHSPWNIFIKIQFEQLDQLSPVQRIAAVALLYDAEGNNNGNLGVFCYRNEFQPAQLIEALLAIGAHKNLQYIRKIVNQIGFKLPTDHDERDEYVMSMWTDDLDEYEGMADHNEVTKCIEIYFEAHESEFIRWVP